MEIIQLIQTQLQTLLFNSTKVRPTIQLKANGIISNIDDILLTSKNYIYPNPTSGKVIIKTPEDFTKMEIIDNLGNKIKSFNKNDYNFNDKIIEWDGIDDLGNSVNNGYYIVLISGINKVNTTQLIIAK